MKAAVYKTTGSASDVLQIVDLQKPIAGPDEVLVSIHASGINPTDTKTRAGIFPIQGEWECVVPHHDGAGVIEAVGDGVSESRIGERVWLHSIQLAGADGTAAEYVIANSANAIRLPDSIDFDAGATFGVPLLTAYRAVTLDGSVSGKVVIIQGGAGAVGNFAIQIAREKGATVIATVSSHDKGLAATSAGADYVINYNEEDVVQCVHEFTAGAGVDHIVEVNLSANAAQLPGLIKNGGFVAVYGSDDFTGEFPAVGAVIQQMRFGFFIVFMLSPTILDQAVHDLTAMLESGKIVSQLHSRLPLERIAEAHDLVDAKTTIGNVVLSMH